MIIMIRCKMSPKKEYPTIPRKDTYIIDKDVDRYWTNEYGKGYYRIVCGCHNINFDPLVYYDNISWSDIYFMNHNKKILTTMIANTNMFINYLFKDSNDSVIGYLDVRYELSNIILIKDVNGDQIAILKKSQLGIDSTWNITVTNQDHILSDPSILLALVGKREFGQYFDICNITWLAILSVGTILGIILMLAYIQVYRELSPHNSKE